VAWADRGRAPKVRRHSRCRRRHAQGREEDRSSLQRQADRDLGRRGHRCGRGWNRSAGARPEGNSRGRRWPRPSRAAWRDSGHQPRRVRGQQRRQLRQQLRLRCRELVRPGQSRRRRHGGSGPDRHRRRRHRRLNRRNAEPDPRCGGRRYRSELSPWPPGVADAFSAAVSGDAEEFAV